LRSTCDSRATLSFSEVWSGGIPSR
jgi:hypothetical protein